MKSMKKLVLVGLVLLASVMVLAGCDTNAGDSSSGADAPTQQPTGDGSGKTETPKFTVTFETDHGTAPKDLVVESGTKLTAEQLPSLADTDDYIFEGWQVKGTTTLVQAGFEVTKDVTLVAKWRDRDTTSSVSFDPPDGTKFFYDEPVTVTLATTEEASIKYKLGEGEWQDYSGPIEILSQNTITAYAIKEGLKDSEKTSATYTVRELTSISITPPTRTVYSVGGEFAPTGMEVTANYDDGKERPVEGTITSETSSLTKSAGINKEVSVSYTEGDNIVTVTFTVDVASYQFTETVQNYEYPAGKTGTASATSIPAVANPLYKKFGDWPQTIKADDVTVGSGTLVRGGLSYHVGSDGNYYVKHNDDYYKVEPIIWRVLNKDYATTGKALLLAEKILTGGIPYYVDTATRTITGAGTIEEEPNTVYPNNYKYSTIRAWLNGSYETDDTQEKNYEGKGFLQTAFTEGAQKLIESTKVDNSARSTNPDSNAILWDDGENEYACDNTEDKIFLLSAQEATTEEYGFGEYSAKGQGNTRIRVTTGYAEATGAYQDSTTGWWWLRSPFYLSEYFARIISIDGDANDNRNVSNIGMGVVPALYIKLQ